MGERETGSDDVLAGNAEVLREESCFIRFPHVPPHHQKETDARYSRSSLAYRRVSRAVRVRRAAPSPPLLSFLLHISTVSHLQSMQPPAPPPASLRWAPRGTPELRSMSFPYIFIPRSLMDDVFSRLMALTSYLSQKLLHFIDILRAEDLVFRDFRSNSQHPQNPFDGRQIRTLYHSCHSTTDNSSLYSNSSNAGACILHSGRSTVDHNKHFSVNIGSGCFQKKRFYGDSLIADGLTFPLHGFRLFCRLTFSYFKCLVTRAKSIQVQLQGFMSCVKKTLRGSSEDIGWLERIEGLPPVTNGTTRFLELLYDIRNGKHSLPNLFVYLLIPGLFSNHSSLYFVNTKRFFSKMGLACHIAKIHSEASVEKNAWELKQYIEELYWGSGKQVLILGHSKGGVDAAAALSIYWSDLKEKVAGLALVQSPYGGSPIASDILREGQIAHKEARKIMEFVVCKLIKGDIRALEDLTYEKRKEFITQNMLPSDKIPLVSFHTEASVAPGVLTTMSHIAHAELPWLPIPSFGSDVKVGSWKLPVVVPLSAAMAACTLHLKLRYGEKSDGLVTRRDAEVPGSTVVRLERKLDHAWMVYSSLKENYGEANACEMCEALLSLLVEIGKAKQEQYV
ncbi:hypothetical protein Taro_031176 [Colocasia esculenta]|uniref:Alpha/beta-Hydrolases superfamily protein n=1 Tax=Colocasia esculenta TaxID=4460 RepID=A0A843VPC8_COLES|nr:hypothetical protein [Colocasia esculenta]